jgi:transcriptional regulator with XRE-family HTH domain
MEHTNNLSGQPATLGSYVQQRRLFLGLSQRQLARMIGLHHSSLSRLESGEIGDGISREFIQGLAKALRVDVSELYEFVGVTDGSELPSVRTYFRRKLGVDAAEADVLANLVADYQQRRQQGEVGQSR